MEVTIPHDWQPRPYQLAAWKALEGGIKRSCLIWHRRSGKDDIALNWTAVSAFERIGTYWHLLPQANQARKAIWDAVNARTGVKRIDQAFPKEIRHRTREQEMFIELRNGSTWQVVGSDNYNSLIGSPPIGVVYSEYALADPNAWAFLRPILAENGGWAMFITTPRGRNHAHALYEMARKEAGWFGQHLTVTDTGAIPASIIETERRELAAERGEEEAENIINQEYFCNFDAAIPGAYYGAQIAKLEVAGRIGAVPHDPTRRVITAWDLGVGDSTAIWFVQLAGLQVRVIDHYENSGVGADHYAKVLNERGYDYDYHILPHDADDREWGNNATSRVDVLKSLKIKPLRIMSRATLEDGINAVRVLLPRCVFDSDACSRGLSALRQYQKRWDEKNRSYSQAPLHDWTSHAADAFRYLAQGLRADTSGKDRPKYALG